MMSTFIDRFFFPAITKKFLIRLLLVGFVSYLVFGYLLIPLHVRGKSMEPNYRDGSFTFCWRLRYALSSPSRFDVVAVRFSGTRIMLLKRIVALQGETVEFRQGQLYVDGERRKESYVRYQSAWDLAPRTVPAGHVYVIGDNRGVDMNRHQFGAVSLVRIAGGVL
ncbi:MAG: signal peptidase I [Desulforhopalus sp.]